MRRRLPLAVALGAVVTLACGASAAIIRVPEDYPTIQQAIDAAADGDQVLVAPGACPEEIDFLGKAIHVLSEAGPEVTVIIGSSETPRVSFLSDEGQASILEGFRVEGGSGFACVSQFSGPTIRGCLFIGPATGVNCVASTARIEACDFQDVNDP